MIRGLRQVLALAAAKGGQAAAKYLTHTHTHIQSYHD